jgi:hypothetical protein
VPLSVTLYVLTDCYRNFGETRRICFYDITTLIVGKCGRSLLLRNVGKQCGIALRHYLEDRRISHVFI